MKRWITLLLTLTMAAGLALPAGAAWEPPEGAVNAEAVYLYNLDTDTVVYEKNAHEVRAAASLTKMMTGLLLCESGEDLSATFTIPEDLRPEFDRIQEENGSDADLKIGETVTLESLLYACMLPSGNDAASAIAYYLGNGDLEAFYARMNQRAAELGCENTNFVCAHGLYGLEYGNHSTAYDQFLIAKACRQNEQLMQVVTQNGYWMPLTNLHTTPKTTDAPEGKAYYVPSTNVMQDPGQELYRPYIQGIKTGFTDEAGRCFVSSAVANDQTWLLVVMGAPKQLAEDGFNYSFHTTANLFDWVFQTFFIAQLPNIETPLATVPLQWCEESEEVGLYADEAETITQLQAVGSKVEVVCDGLPANLSAPVKAGAELGKARILVDGQELGTVTLYTVKDYERSAKLYYTDLLRPYLPLAIGVLLLLAGLVIAAFTIRHKNLKKRKRRVALRR